MLRALIILMIGLCCVLGIGLGHGGVNDELAWEAVLDEDLAGYKVYARAVGTTEWQMCEIIPADTTRVPIEMLLLIDGTYDFAVTSFDHDGNETLVSECGYKEVLDEGERSALAYRWDTTPPGPPTGCRVIE